MMNSKALEKKINRDLERARRDLSELSDDIITRLRGNFGQLADNPRKSATVAMKNLNKSIGQGLEQYNTRVQDVVDRVPGDIGKKARGYPWVAITMSMLLGLMVGGIIRFARHMAG